MQLFFPYYGGKLKLAADLGPPQRDHVIEPFAGAAGFSVFWEPRAVTLVERDPIIVGLWRFLRRVRSAELMRLPSNISDVGELPAGLPEEARWLIGFWFNHGLAQPGVHRSNWARQARYHGRFWSKTVKLRLATQVERIRHWKVIEGSYESAPDIEAHWHIDPPYAATGHAYRFNGIKYELLAEWCLQRRGFVQVCEAQGADWLRFEPLVEVDNSGIRGRNSRRGLSREAVFEIEQ
jgi:hypothetical protein